MELLTMFCRGQKVSGENLPDLSQYDGLPTMLRYGTFTVPSLRNVDNPAYIPLPAL